MRLDDQAVRMEVGRIADQARMFHDVLGIGRRRQMVHQADFQRIARGQLQVDAAQGMRTVGRAHILLRRGALADLINPGSGLYFWRDLRWNRTRDHDQIQGARMTGEHGWIHYWVGIGSRGGQGTQQHGAQGHRHRETTCSHDELFLEGRLRNKMKYAIIPSQKQTRPRPH
jgi:hypothetical protein